jgi:hypothetical protein
MATRLHPTTIRLTEDDQTFLSLLSIPGASTISDKIRALIEDRRVQYEASRDFRSALTLASSLIAPLGDAVKVAENESRMHSQFVRRVLEWMPELVASALADGISSREQVPERQELEKLERALVDQVMRLVDITLQSYVARDTAFYTPESLNHDKLKPIRRLCRLVEDDNN